MLQVHQNNDCSVCTVLIPIQGADPETFHAESRHVTTELQKCVVPLCIDGYI